MLKELWERIRGGAAPKPEAAEHRPPHGVEMGPGPENFEYVIRLADGSYYAGPGMAPGAIERCPMANRAARFGNRWAALQAATAGPVFANAIIVTVEDPPRKAGQP